MCAQLSRSSENEKNIHNNTTNNKVLTTTPTATPMMIGSGSAGSPSITAPAVVDIVEPPPDVVVAIVIAVVVVVVVVVFNMSLALKHVVMLSTQMLETAVLNCASASLFGVDTGTSNENTGAPFGAVVVRTSLSTIRVAPLPTLFDRRLPQTFAK